MSSPLIIAGYIITQEFRGKLGVWFFLIFLNTFSQSGNRLIQAGIVKFILSVIPAMMILNQRGFYYDRKNLYDGREEVNQDCDY